MRRILLLLTVALVMAAMMVAMAMPAMAFNSSQHCPPSEKALSDTPCPVPTEGPPATAGGPEASHRQGTKGNEIGHGPDEDRGVAQGNPSSVTVHCSRVPDGGSGTMVVHFDKEGNPTKTTGGGEC